LGFHEDVVGIAVLVLLIGGHQCLGDLLEHIGLGNAPLLFQLRQRGENLLVHIVPIPPSQNSTVSRTRATSFGSNVTISPADSNVTRPLSYPTSRPWHSLEPALGR